MKNKLLIIKNIFCAITVIWSFIMLMTYSSILLPVQFTGILYYVFDFSVLFLFLGIWCVPVLFIVSLVLIACVRKNNKENKLFTLLNAVTVIIPGILTVLMLLTDFNSRLQ